MSDKLRDCAQKYWGISHADCNAEDDCSSFIPIVGGGGAVTTTSTTSTTTIVVDCVTAGGIGCLTNAMCIGIGGSSCVPGYMCVAPRPCCCFP